MVAVATKLIADRAKDRLLYRRIRISSKNLKNKKVEEINIFINRRGVINMQFETREANKFSFHYNN